MASTSLSAPLRLLFLLLLLSSSQAALLVSNSSSLATDTTYQLIQEWFDGSTLAPPSLLAPVLAIPFPYSNDDFSLNNSIVLLRGGPGNLWREVRDAAFALQRRNASAIVINYFDRVCGRLHYQAIRGTTTDLTLPIFTMYERPFLQLFNSVTNSTTALLTVDGTTNPWRGVFEHPFAITLCSVLAIAYAVIFIFGLVRIGQFIKEKGLQLSIALVALALDVVSSPVAVVYWAGSPFQSRRVWANEAGNIMLTFPIPFFAAAHLLVFLFWLEILTMKKLRTVSFLKRLRIPFFIWCSYLILTEVVTVVVRVFVLSQVTVIISAVNGIISLIFLIVCIFIVLRYIRKAQASGLVVSDKLKRMNRFMIAMAVLAIIDIVCIVLFITPVSFEVPWANVLTLTFAHYASCGLLVCQILTFQPDSSRYKSSAESELRSGPDSARGKDGVIRGTPTNSHKAASKSSSPNTGHEGEASESEKVDS